MFGVHLCVVILILASHSVFSSPTYGTGFLKADKREGPLIFASPNRKNRIWGVVDAVSNIDENERTGKTAAEMLGEFLRLDWALGLQTVLSLCVCFNLAIEPIISRLLRHRIRMQGLMVGALLSIFDIFLRLGLPSFEGLHDSSTILKVVRNNTQRFVGGHECQMFAYCSLALICGSQEGCMLPVVMREIPFLVQVAIGIYVAFQPSNLKTKILDTSAARFFSTGESQIDVIPSLNFEIMCGGIALFFEVLLFSASVFTHVVNIFHQKVSNIFDLVKSITISSLILQYFLVRGNILKEIINRSQGGNKSNVETVEVAR